MPSTPSGNRVAVVDCNNFYATCEQVFDPSLRGRPVVVLSNNDGCVIARSAEARALGIPMGAPAHLLMSLFRRHDVVLRSSNFALYADMSRRVMQVLREATPELEVYSIDEAFLRIPSFALDDPARWGKALRTRVLRWTGIAVSVGIASTRTLAKIANRLAKHISEDGVWVLEDDEETLRVWLSRIRVEEVWGIGPRMARILHRHGIHTAWDFREAPADWIRAHFSVTGARTQMELRGRPTTGLLPDPPPRKSLRSGRTFPHPVTRFSTLREAVAAFAARVGERLREESAVAGRLGLYLSTGPHRDPSHRISDMVWIRLPVYTDATPLLIQAAHHLLEAMYRKGFGYKKAAVMTDDLYPRDRFPQPLFPSDPRIARWRQISAAMDRINQTWGRDTVRWAITGIHRNWQSRRQRLSPAYTTRWSDLPRASTLFRPRGRGRFRPRNGGEDRALFPDQGGAEWRL